MIDYSSVLSAIYGDAEWSIGETYESLVWMDDSPAPSKKTLDDAWPAVRDALAWERVRVERDRLLAASDWTQVADAPVDAAAWAVYRQTLRDVPQDFATPEEVVWPTAP